ncbi:pyrroline-5-carboxylate reductase family protein, partial [Methylobacterium haplocladii]
MTGASKGSLPASLTLVGAGRMGGALLRGWLDGGLDPAGTTVVDPQVGPEITALCAERGVALNPDRPPVAQTLILAMKPQGLDDAAATLAPLVGPGT